MYRMLYRISEGFCSQIPGDFTPVVLVYFIPLLVQSTSVHLVIYISKGIAKLPQVYASLLKQRLSSM